MSKTPVILDNRRAKLADYLLARLHGADIFRVVSAYFSVFGFETLADAMESSPRPKVRFLFGNPESAAQTAGGEKTSQTFALTESGLSVQDGILQQRALADRCQKWAAAPNVQVREIRPQNFLHGKMYHITSSQTPANNAATVGSSNFTRRGMGKSQNPNIEINLAAESAEEHAALATWFDELWDDTTLTEDAKPKLLAALQRWHEERAPEFIYYKTLLELFREDIESRKDEDGATADYLRGTQIWNALYEFQKDGADTVINRLRRRRGCILADSVGLGKTYTALAVVKDFELRNKSVLVLCPKKLEQNWRTYQASAANTRNPFPEDKFGYALLSHTDLGRESGMAGNIDLSNFNWGVYDLVVIDESHNFRNYSKNRRNDKGEIIRRSRYQTLLEEVVKNGAQTKVLMLSATPVNTSLADLQNQIHLMTGGDDSAFAESLRVASVRATIKAAQKKFHEWENQTRPERKKSQLLASLGGDFLNLLGGVTIARSRRQIKKFYGDFIAQQGDFPKREKPVNQNPHTDLQGELSHDQLYNDIAELKFHIYRPSDYIAAGQPGAAAHQRLDEEKAKLNFNQQDREKFLVAMMRVNFLKRLESSAHACNLTLQRALDKIETQVRRIDKFLQTREDALADIPDDADDDAQNEQMEDEEFFVSRRATTPYHLDELNVAEWRDNMLQDKHALQTALAKVRQIAPARDGKLAELKKQIRQKAALPNRKLLVFTAFKDTAKYLYENLRPLADELKIRAAFVAGDQTAADKGHSTFAAILDRFSPRARQQDCADEIDLLIATDCISEGQNLQDCDTVLNYDIHWNPVRLIQRFGRIDRIGSQNASVRMINYWPTDDINKYLKLRDRVYARMALVDVAATGDDDALNQTDALQNAQESATMELQFRDQQLRQMRDEITDLEDMDDSVNMSDLTADYFIAQLMRYLQANKDKLEEAPNGTYAVADAANGDPKDALQNGAIFLFRRTALNGEDNAPLYLVHAEQNKVRGGHLKLRDTLRIFESIALGHKNPLLDLCDMFTSEIQTQDGKQFYDELAKLAIADTAQTVVRRAAESLRRDAARGGILPTNSERPAVDNMQLITWLVVKNTGATQTPTKRRTK